MTPDTTCPCVCLPSPNADERSAPVDLLVLHYTGMSSANQASEWLREPRSKVSCHYFVHEDGRIEQHVPEARRAWHAGLSCWQGRDSLNGVSLGIEIANPGHAGGLPAFPDAQIEAVIALCRDILTRHALGPDRVVAHSDIAPTRKEDPGEAFPWERFADEGVVLWCPPIAGVETDVDEREAWHALKEIGYCVGQDGWDANATACLRAFQRRFMPGRVDSVLDADALATVLAARDVYRAARQALDTA